MSRDFNDFDDMNEADLRDPALSALMSQLGSRADSTTGAYGTILTRVHRARQRRMIATSAAAVVVLVSGAFVAANRNGDQSPSNPGIAVPLSPGDSVAVQTSILDDGSVVTITTPDSPGSPDDSSDVSTSIAGKNGVVTSPPSGSSNSSSVPSSNPDPGDNAVPVQTTPNSTPGGSGTLAPNASTTLPGQSPAPTVASTVPKPTTAPVVSVAPSTTRPISTAPKTTVPSTPAPTPAPTQAPVVIPKTTVATTVPRPTAPTTTVRPSTTSSTTTTVPARPVLKVCGGGQVSALVTPQGVIVTAVIPASGFAVVGNPLTVTSPRSAVSVRFRGTAARSKATSTVTISRSGVTSCDDENIDSDDSESDNTDDNTDDGSDQDESD